MRFWAEVPALTGCVTQVETLAELLATVREAIQTRVELIFPRPHR
jgi:predicted RNase H-like HicB family nuclease